VRLCNHSPSFETLLAYVGPGNCLGVLASKTGPTAVRGQYYGIAAAIGKIGAFIGTWGTCRTGFVRRVN
jgi:hypothetical protein